jgi:Fe2+ or Zn2+ uptake regulation protein
MKKRNTIQRELVLNAAMELDHPSAEEVYNKIILTYPTISKGTVYRNLNSLTEDGELLKITVPDSADRYDTTLKLHYHIKCTKCGLFSDLNISYLSDIDKKISLLTGFKLESHEIVFKGVCKNCINQ